MTTSIKNEVQPEAQPYESTEGDRFRDEVRGAGFGVATTVSGKTKIHSPGSAPAIVEAKPVYTPTENALTLAAILGDRMIRHGGHWGVEALRDYDTLGLTHPHVTHPVSVQGTVAQPQANRDLGSRHPADHGKKRVTVTPRKDAGKGSR